MNIKEVFDNFSSKEKQIESFKKTKNFSKCIEITREIINELKQFIINNKNIPFEQIKALLTMESSYDSHLRSYEIMDKLSLKEKKVKEKMDEKYLTNKDALNKQSEVEQENSQIITDFEVLNTPLIKEIIDLVAKLLKDNPVEENKVRQSIQDCLLNSPLEMNKFLIQNCVNHLKEISDKCKDLKQYVCDTDKIKELQDEIRIIENEYNKLHNKNEKLNKIKKKKRKESL